MIVFFVTVLAVAALLTLDRVYSNKPKEPIKYTNLDWEIVDDGYYDHDCHYYGRIYSVVKNKVVTVYESKIFTKSSQAKEYIQKIYPAMCAEYGLLDTHKSSIYESQLKNIDFSQLM